MTWRLVKGPKWRLVSNRMAQLPVPGADDRNAPSVIRQVVVRISSRQKLIIDRDSPNIIAKPRRGTRELKWVPDGTQLNRDEAREEEEYTVDEHEKDVVEYIVLQKRIMKGEEEPWKVWGFMDNTTVESLKEEDKMADRIAEYDAAHPSLV
jgi:mitochondrial protein MBA1